MKKKLLSLLALVMCFGMGVGSLTACDSEATSGSESTNSGNSSTEEGNSSTDGGNSSTEEGGNSSTEEGDDVVTEEEWDEAIGMSNFSNVTFGYSVVFDGDTKVNEGLYKLIGNESSFVNPEDNYSEERMDAEETEALKSVFVSTMLAVLENFDDFAYDAEAGAFVSKADIVYNVTVMEYEAKITAKNVKAKFDANKNVTEISCDMKQEFKENGEDDVLSMKVTFTFTDYGTTEFGGSQGGSGDVGGEEADLDVALENTMSATNVTMNVYAVETFLDGTEEIDEERMATTETALYRTDGETEMYFSIEEGSTYSYVKSGDGWMRVPTQTNAPIGAIAQMYIGLFANYINEFTYDEEEGVYVAENITVNMGIELVFKTVKIKVENGKVTQVYYVTDVYDNSGSEPVLEGEGVATLTFTNYGTTVVTLPTDYTDPSQGNEGGGGSGTVVDKNKKISEAE